MSTSGSVRGRNIIKTVLQEHGITAVDFFGPCRTAPVVASRADAIRRMHDHGFSNADMARLMKRNESSITYWRLSGYREKRRLYLADRRAKTRPEGTARKVTPAQRAELVDLYQAGVMGKVLRLQEAYGVAPRYTYLRVMSLRAAKTRVRPDLPVLAPIRDHISRNSPSPHTEAGA